MLQNDDALRFLWRAGTEAVTADGTTIKESDIVFLPDKNQIWVNGVYFGLTDAQKTELTQATTHVADLTTRVGTLETNVGSTTALATSLAATANALQAAIDGGEVYHIGSGEAPTATDLNAAFTNQETGHTDNIYEALNRLHTMASAASAAAGVTGVQAGSGVTVVGTSSSSGHQTGLITISTDASQVQMTSGGPEGFQSGSVESAIVGIQAAIAGVQSQATDAATAATGAQTNANGRVLISTDDNTPETLSGAQGSAMTTTAAIADALEAAYGRLLGTQTDFENEEDKTLGQLRTLIKGLRGDVSTLQTTVSGMDTDSAQKILDIIAELKQVEDSDSGNFADTILDRLTPFLAYASTYASDGTPNGAQGYYEVDKLDGTQSYVNNVQGIIDALTSEIAAAKNAGVQAGVTTLNTGAGNITLSGTQGVQVDAAPTNGTITVKGTSAALTTDALTQTGGYGANTAAGSTVQTALQDVNNAAAGAASAAATADGKAVAAQSSADAALTQLKWVVVSSGNQNNEP